MIAVQRSLRHGLSYRDVEELLAERGITADHVTIFRWVQRFTPLLIDDARCADALSDRHPCRRLAGAAVANLCRQKRRDIDLAS
jgi:hypothetical protein